MPRNEKNEETRGLAAQEKSCCLDNVSIKVLLYCANTQTTANSTTVGAKVSEGILWFILKTLQQRNVVVTLETCLSFPSVL